MSGPQTETEARALLNEGIAAIEAAQFDKAVGAFAQAAAIAAQEGNKVLEARAYANIASACATRHDHAAAVDMYRCVLFAVAGVRCPRSPRRAMGCGNLALRPGLGSRLPSATHTLPSRHHKCM